MEKTEKFHMRKTMTPVSAAIMSQVTHGTMEKGTTLSTRSR